MKFQTVLAVLGSIYLILQILDKSLDIAKKLTERKEDKHKRKKGR